MLTVVGRTTMVPEYSTRVGLSGSTDKRYLTLTLTVTFPYYLWWQNQPSLPKVTFPEGFSQSVNQKHYSDIDKASDRNRTIRQRGNEEVRRFPDIYHPGHLPPGHLPLGHLPPGHLPPGHLPPGHLPPGHIPPGHLPPGHLPPGHLPPGQLPPGQVSHRTFTT